MPIEMHLVVKPYGFIPASAVDERAKERFALDSTIKATITRDRSPRLLRFYWAVVNKVADGVGYDKDALHNDLLRATGHIKTFLLSNGWRRVIPVGLSDMDHWESVAYINAAIEIIITDYLPDMTRADLVGDVEKMLNLTYADAIKPPKGTAH